MISNNIFHTVFRKNFSLVLITTLLVCQLAEAQNNIPLGAWRSHFAVNNTVTLDWDGANTIYAGAPQGLVRFDIESNSFDQLSKQDGFSESEVAKIKYHDKLKLWIITYINGNIDIIDDNRIYNLNSVLRNTSITNSKKVNHISFNENNAYLSMDFGIVVLNLTKKEIKESYLSIGDNGSAIQVYSTTFLKDSIFVAGSKGIIASALNSNVNKLDYRNWRKIPDNRHPAKPSMALKYKLLTTLNNVLYAATDTFGIASFSENQWKPIYKSSNTTSATYNFLSTFKNTILTSIGNTFIGINNDTTIYEGCFAPLDVVSKDGKRFWAVSNTIGICYHDGTNNQSFQLKGVYRPDAFRLFSHDGYMFCTSGGYSSTGGFQGTDKGFYRYYEGDWENFNPTNGAFPGRVAVSDVTYNPFENNYYFSCFDGLVQWKSKNEYKTFNASNALFTDLYPGNSFYFNYGVAVDSKGTTWASVNVFNSLKDPVLFSKGLSDDVTSWKKFILPFSTLNSNGNLFIDKHDNIWLCALENMKGGVVVFNEKKNQSRRLTDISAEGTLTSPVVNCVEQARSGEIWLGTNNGVCTISDPQNVFNSNLAASIPVYDSRALLRNKMVNCIKADAADRKWIGTADGLWLFNQDGSELIQYYNMENSPLPSNIINDIDIIDKTGEVFIATSKGVVSYRSDATLGSDTENGAATVFPNPIKPDYNGVVAVSGLINDAVVKITDISGTLVYQCVSKGSTASWNLHDIRGKRVQAGIYLIFSSTSQGEGSLISKLAILE